MISKLNIKNYKNQLFNTLKKIPRKTISFFKKAYFFTFRLIIQIAQKNNKFDKNKVIIFLGNNKGTILHNLLRELESELCHFLTIEFVFSIEILQYKFLKNNCWVLTSHQSQVDLINKSGIYLRKVLTIYTHTRFSNINKFLKYSKYLKGILSISQNEKSRLIANNLTKENSYYFPIGYCPKLFPFYKNDDISKRKYDVVFSLSYQRKFKENGQENHYHTRKRYQLVVEIANHLSKKGFNICIIGKNWEKCEYPLNPKIKIITDGYPKYRKYYLNSKIFCMPSLLEGSPTGIAEAISTGCYLISSPTGWAVDLQPSSNFGIKLIPFEAKYAYWVKIIEDTLKSTKELNLSNELKINRKLFLKEVDFKFLAFKFKDILNN